MKKYQIKARVELMRKVYFFDDVVPINIDGLSSYGLRCIAYGMIYQEVQNSKSERFVKIRDLEIKEV